MKTKIRSTLAIAILLITIGCDKNSDEVKPEIVDLINNQFPAEQTEIQTTLDELFTSIGNKDADKLISFHVYGPKFTEFNESQPRKGAAENEAYERGFVDAISAFEYDLEDLKIDVFGKVAVITFHANYRPTIGENMVQLTGGVTLIFVKVNNEWKITHEHFSPLSS